MVYKAVKLKTSPDGLAGYLLGILRVTGTSDHGLTHSNIG